LERTTVLSCILGINRSLAVSFSNISGQRKLQRDRAHPTIRAKGAKRGQSTSGQRGSCGENHPWPKGRSCQIEIFIIGKGKKLTILFIV